MKGVIFEKAEAKPQVVDNLEKPKPSPDQILVKSIYTAINPVDSFMSGTGMLVTAWPFVPGCDAAGVVVEVGDNVGSKFKFGDEVCGCTRVGVSGHSTMQEFFLMDAALTMLKPRNVSLKQAATLGVGTYTAALGLYKGLAVPLPDVENLPQKGSKDESKAGSKSPPVEEVKGEEELSKNDEGAEVKDAASRVEDGAPQSTQTKTVPQETKDWIVVLGGASSVGKYAIQLAMVAGYRVAASCSERSARAVKDLGAVLFDYKKPIEHQVKEVMSITSGTPFRIFDAAATGDALAKELFKVVQGGEKLFTTTNDWSGITDFEGGKTYAIELGPIGRPESSNLNAEMEKIIPVIVGLVEKGMVVPNPYDIVGKGGFEDAIEALKYQQSGAGGSNKVLVKIQNP